MKTLTKLIEIRSAVLARHLGVERDEIESAYEYATFSVGSAEYRVLTDAEATDAARTEILESVWAFRPEFLAAHTVAGVDAETIQTIQDNGKCESNNAVLLRLIGDVDHFVDDAIKVDGRGHFLSSYDSEENEIKVDGEWFFIYRVN